MISGIDPTADIAAPAWGSTNPAAKIGGGFHAFFLSSNAAQYNPGMTLILTSSLSSATLTDLASIPPSVAMAIDTKIDDGFPGSGSVIADPGATNCNTGGARPQYQPDSNGGRCFIMYAMD